MHRNRQEYDNLAILRAEGLEDETAKDAIETIRRVLKSMPSGIAVQKKGMTNRSFLFECMGKKYMMRIPGAGTGSLVNRRQEAAVYREVNGKDICDDVVYIDPETGYKISHFLEEARVCDPLNADDIRKCMRFLRSFHERKLAAGCGFDLFAQIDFYESLREGAPSVYGDYQITKNRVFSLKSYIDLLAEEKVLVHIDAVPDNFLFLKKDGKEQIRLVDWEYAGMQDPHVDIAMFCIYALYDRQQADRLIRAYFPEGCKRKIRTKIYCYIAVCGLLWSNWCEYKRMLGAEFGGYAGKQYDYAKNYYRIAQKEIRRQKPCDKEEGTGA